MHFIFLRHFNPPKRTNFSYPIVSIFSKDMEDSFIGNESSDFILTLIPVFESFTEFIVSDLLSEKEIVPSLLPNATLNV